MGANWLGQQGTGDSAYALAPRDNPAVQAATKVTVGTFNTYFVDGNGTLWAMGANQFQQMPGIGAGGASEPRKLLEGVKDCFGAYASVAVVKMDGTVWWAGKSGGGLAAFGTASAIDGFQRVFF